MGKWKRLGIDTDVWALIDESGSVRGGDYKPCVYWTKKVAKEHLSRYPECILKRVRIQVRPLFDA